MTVIFLKDGKIVHEISFTWYEWGVVYIKDKAIESCKVEYDDIEVKM